MNTCNFLFITGPNIGRHCLENATLIEGNKRRCEKCIHSSWPKQQIHPCTHILNRGKRAGQVCGKNTRFSDLTCSVCRRTGAGVGTRLKNKLQAMKTVTWVPPTEDPESTDNYDCPIVKSTFQDTWVPSVEDLESTDKYDHLLVNGTWINQ